MDLLKKDNKIFIKIKGGDMPEVFFADFNSGKIETESTKTFFRLEHPHCAFFKSTHTHAEKEYLRTTLYTPEGRLHIDCEKEEEKKGHEDKYVTKKEHLDILLFYLRDLEVKPAICEINDKIILIEMPQTPMSEFLSFADNELFSETISEYEVGVKHILSQLRRIYNEKIEILQTKIKGRAEYAVFEDISNIDINDELLERWHYYYIRKIRLLK